MPRFAANLTWLFTEHPFEDRFAAAADAGFEAVEILFPYDAPAAQVARLCARNRLDLVLINAPAGDFGRGERGFACLAGAEAAFDGSIETARGYALETGARRVHVLAGKGDGADPACWQRYEAALARAGERLAPDGITVLIEPLNGRDNPGYLLGDFWRAEALVRRLGPPLALQFDLYHRQVSHGDVVRGLERMIDVIGHVQVASAPDRAEPGSGEINDAMVFATLDRLGYAGHVGAEYRPKGRTEDGLGWFAPWRGRAGSSA